MTERRAVLEHCSRRLDALTVRRETAPDATSDIVSDKNYGRRPDVIDCPDGGIGRHKGLKIPRLRGRAGSTPAPGTIFRWLNNDDPE